MKSKKLICLIVLSLVLLSFALAKEQENSAANAVEAEENERVQTETMSADGSEEIPAMPTLPGEENSVEPVLISAEPQEATVAEAPTEVAAETSTVVVESAKAEEGSVIKSGGVSVRTRSDVEVKENKVYVNKKLVKVMPETASARALEVLGAKCEERNCTIELKEVGQGNETRLTYELKTKKKAKFLGLFPTEMEVSAEVDADSGEVIKTHKPWWAFLAKEEAETSE